MSRSKEPLPGGIRRRWAVRSAAVLTLSASLACAGLAVPAFAADAAGVDSLILGVGTDESQRILTWYSPAEAAQSVELAPASQVVDGEFPASAVTFKAEGAANVTTGGGYNRHATITGLAENTKYAYHVGAEGGWSDTYTFRTQDFEGDYDFLYFGDPQIGSSGNVPTDQAGWEDTLNVALAANPDAELMLSAGDQVESAGNETQWTAALAPKQMEQYAWALTNGNHDVGSKAYEQHWTPPNADKSAEFYANGNPSSNTSGGNYWFMHKDTLFININSNSYTTSSGGGGDAAHSKYLTKVVEEHGAAAKYTVVMFHHSIYSPASHAKDSDNKVRRVDLPTTLSKLGVDLVLQGHDHSYGRTYLIKDGEKANPDEKPGAEDVVAGPGGVMYVTANSASGSKYYDITKPDSSGTNGAGNGADPLNPDNYWYSSVQNQEHVRNYVRVKVRNDKLVIDSIRSGTCAAPNSAVQNGSWCNNTAEGQPVGSIVDSVTLSSDRGEGGQEIQVKVEQGKPGEFGWTIDGDNGLVDLGTAEDQDGKFLQAQGEINPITVTDTRSSRAPWSISASVGDFEDADKKFSASLLGWSPKVAAAGAGAKAGETIASGIDGGEGLSVSRTLGSAEQGHEKGEAKLGAGLDLKIPSEVEEGTYRTTLTITALSS